MFSNIINVIIAIAGLIGLVTLHELGHFIVAKRFGVKVEEFGIGFPPRLFGKKFGETLYSLNLLPLGAFVKMPGEVEHSDDPRSFFQKALWKRALIVAAGVISFWIMAVVIFSIVMAQGVPTAISDDDDSPSIVNPRVQITQVVSGSPAEEAGIRIGDNIIAIKSSATDFQAFDKAGQTQEFIQTHKGKELTLTIERGSETFDVNVLARANPPAGEGSLGVGLNRIATQSVPWWQAPWRGLVFTINLTRAIIVGYANLITHPERVEFKGPVGIVEIGTNMLEAGWTYFFLFIGQIAIYIAIFNALPIPALDGGKLLFLGIEAVRRKPINQKVEQIITTVFFGLLILLIILVTSKDIRNIIMKFFQE